MRGTHRLAAAILMVLAGAPIARSQTLPQDSTGQTTPLAPSDGTEPTTLPVLDWAVGLGYEHTDNINRSGLNPTKQDILQPTVNFTYNQRGSTLQAQVVGVIQYVDYLQNFFGNEFRGQLSGTMNWVIAPQRLNFVAQDYSSVEPVSIRASDAPSNRQQVNVLVAGPTLTFRMGDALRGEADLRYVNTTASKTKEFNSQRGMGALSAIRDLSDTSTLAFTGQAVHVDFSNVDPLVNPSRYDQYNAFIQYQSRQRYVDLDFSVGGSSIAFGQGAGSHSSALMRASISWRITPRNTLEIGALNQLADSTTDLVQSPSIGNIDVNNLSIQVGRTAISPVVYRDRGVNLNYHFQGQRWGLTLTPYYTQLRQINGNGLSRNGYGAIAGVTYLIDPLATLGFNAGSQSTRYLSDHSHDRDTIYSLEYLRQQSPHWSWRVAFSHTARNSTRPGFDYNENQIFLILYYRR